MARSKNNRRRVSITSAPHPNTLPTKPQQINPGYTTCKTCTANGSMQCSGQCLLNPASFGHKNPQDVQEAIEYHWKILPLSIKQFLLKDPSSLNLRKFVNFYSSPDHEENTSRNVAASICGCSWYLALHYMFLGQVPEAKGLILNAAFLQEVYNNKPVSEIAAVIANNATGDLTELKQTLPFFHDGLFACQSRENMSAFLRTKLTPTFVAQTSQAKRQAQNYVDYISSSWGEGGGQGNEKDPASDSEDIEVILVDSDSDERITLKIGSASTLKALFNKYADERGVSLRSLRFSYDDKTLFLSSAGQKTPNDLGMKDSDIIVVTKNAQESPVPTSISKSKSNRRNSNSPGNNGLTRRNSMEVKSRRQRRASWTGCIDTQSEEYIKMKHSRRLSLLFEEAQPIFFKIRQELNVLNIERSKPKRRMVTSPSPERMAAPINNPGTDGLGGKAGKVFFQVNVGQVENLYKTCKLASSCSRSKDFCVDLHGHTREEALDKLDECLPEWMDAAMKGEYPFVVPVLIVCGGGAQILSETVERWIKDNDNVANAPKRILRRQTICG